MIGRTLGDLELIELIGVGAAAEVYRGLDLKRGREVAIKVLSERAEPDMVMRFLREGRAMAQLRHPHIVEVREMGEARGLRYIVMELVKGESLKERLLKGRLAWREAATIATQVTQALEYAHAHSIVHRDVKPGNIILDEKGAAKLMDFGLARLSDASSMTRTGTVMGTVFYMSPEQAVGRHVDARSDLYSLGAVLFEMVAGQPPFTGPSAVSIIYKHLNQEPPRLRQLDSSSPPLLEAIVDRLLQKDPERRLQSASEVIAALEEAQRLDDTGPWPEDLGLVASSEDVPVAAEKIPLIGREKELEALAKALDSAISGLGKTVLISGEAGMGKTRLTRELDLVSRERNVLTLVGECLYSDTPNPYAPLVQILRAFEERRGSGPVGVPEERLEAEIQGLLEDIRTVFQLDGLQPQSERVAWLSQASAGDAQAHAFELMVRLFLVASRQRALVLVLDDLQWASPTTLQIFHYLARSLREARILLLGTYRPEDVLPGASGGTHPLRETLRRMSRERLYEEISLTALDWEDVDEIAVTALDSTDLEPGFIDLLTRESEGNPFYVLEIIRLLEEQGVLAQEGDRWELTSPEEISIPGTVLDIIMRRVERVDVRDRELLDWAAVVGQRIDVGVLASVIGEARLAVMRRLHALERGYGLLAADESGFGFAHAKIYQAVYEEMPPSLRRESHLMVGETLEERCGDDPEPFVYDLARHFVKGGDSAKGYRYSRAAADKAEAAFALSEAITYLEETLRLLAEVEAEERRDQERLRLSHRRARLLSTIGRLRESREALKAVLALSRELSDARAEAEVLLDLGIVEGRTGDWSAAIELGDQSLRLSEEADDSQGQASALLTAGFFAFEQGNWDGATRRLQRGLTITRHHDHEWLEARILGNLGIVRNAQGERREAIVLYQKSIETFARLGRPLDVARGISNVGFSYQGLGEHEGAMRSYHEALEMFNKVGDVREQGVVSLHMAEVSLAVRELSEAREHCKRATQRFRRLGFELGITDVDRVYAGIARQEGRWAVAERYLRDALMVYEEHGDQLNVAETHKELGNLLEQAGEGQKATDELERSRTMFETLLRQETQNPEQSQSLTQSGRI